MIVVFIASIVLLIGTPILTFFIVQRTDFFGRSNSILLLTVITGILCLLFYDLIGVFIGKTPLGMAGIFFAIIKIPVVLVCLPFYYQAIKHIKKKADKRPFQIVALGAIIGTIVGYHVVDWPILLELNRHLTFIGIL